MNHSLRDFGTIILSGISILLLGVPQANAQILRSYTLPSPAQDIALAQNGTAVVSMIGSEQLWVRDSLGVVRTPSFTQGQFKTQIKSDGSIVYLLGVDNRDLIVFDLRTDSPGLRSFSALPTDFQLSRDEKNVVVALSDKTSIVSDTTNFDDGTPITLNAQPTSVVIAPSSSVAYVGAGSSIVQIELAGRRVLQQIRMKGTVEKLAMSPSGTQLYAITSRVSAKGETVRALSVINAKTRKVITSRTLQVSGTENPTFDIEAGTKNIFIASSQPLKVGARTAGVVRLSIRAATLGRAYPFAQVNAGAGPIAYNESSRTLGVVLPASQSVQFMRTPRA